MQSRQRRLSVFQASFQQQTGVTHSIPFPAPHLLQEWPRSCSCGRGGDGCPARLPSCTSAGGTRLGQTRGYSATKQTPNESRRLRGHPRLPGPGGQSPSPPGSPCGLPAPPNDPMAGDRDLCCAGSPQRPEEDGGQGQRWGGTRNQDTGLGLGGVSSRGKGAGSVE